MTANGLSTDVFVPSQLTLLETRSHLANRLAEVGILDAPLEAELLIRHVTGLDRAALFRDSDRQLSSNEYARLEALAKRRLAREPLAYILGEREFYGLSFLVDTRVLIPRQETETLVDLALTWVRSRSPEGANLTIADIGTGSGCIAVSLAVQLPSARIIATDMSTDALSVARLNAERHSVLEGLDLRSGDLLAPIETPVDAIVANLPYVAETDRDVLAPEILEYEPALALFAGDDGMSLLRRLLADATSHLRTGGAIFLELDPRQAQALRQIAEVAFPAGSVSIHRDLAGQQRVLVLET